MPKGKPTSKTKPLGAMGPGFYYGFLCAYPLVLLLVFEGLKPEAGFLALLAGHPSVFIALGVVAINYLLFLSLVFLFYALLKDMLSTSILISLLLLVFYGINYFRWLNTGFAFTPQDLALAGRAFSIATFAAFPLTFKMSLSLTALILCILFFYLHRPAYRKMAASGKKRLLLLAGCLGWLGLLLLPVGKGAVSRLFRLEPSRALASTEALYTNHGSLLGFLLLAGSPPVPSAPQPGEAYQFNPEALQAQYTEAQMALVAQDILELAPKARQQMAVKPNVIVVMSEAFWDPSNLKQVQFSSPPLPNYNQLAAEHQAGHILTPAIGGLTSNVEYELLMMDSMLFYTEGFVPFEKPNQTLPENDPLALPWQFKQNGYNTVAIHPYDRYFYNRGVLYPRLGFDQFIAQDEMPDAPLSGNYISDSYFTQRMIEALEQSKEPLFLFGISMENHYPYDPYRYQSHDITAAGPALSPPELLPLNTYTQGVHNADKALGQLIAYLESQPEPTLLFFFGDHLPILENNPFNLFYKGNYLSTPIKEEWTLQDTQHLYNTPYLFWANFPVEAPPVNDLSPLFIGPMLLDAAQLEMSPHAAYLLDSMRYFNGLHHHLYIDQEGRYLTQPPQQAGPRLDNLYYLHLDRFPTSSSFGRQYAGKYLVP